MSALDTPVAKTAASPVAVLSSHPPQIIVVGGQKGGTGKTTTATQIIIMAAKAGLKVLAIDADRANAMTEFFHRRAAKERLEPQVSCIQKLIPSKAENQGQAARAFAREVGKLAQDYDLVVVDTAGFDAEDRKNLELRGALIVADLFLVTSRPGMYDRRLLPQVWSMAEDARYFRQQVAGDEEAPPLDVICVLNAAPTNPVMKDVEKARKDLAELVPDMPVAAETIGHRSIYSRTAEEGISAIEAKPNQGERTEMLRLYRLIMRSDYMERVR